MSGPAGLREPRAVPAPTFADPQNCPMPVPTTFASMRSGLPADSCLTRPVGDDAAMSRLRLQWAASGSGVELWRCDDHEVIEQAATSIGRARPDDTQAGRRPQLLPLVFLPQAAAAAPAPAPAAGPAPAAPAPAPGPAEATFAGDLDVAAMVAALRDAAQSGAPFCEECERARQQSESQAA